MIGASPPLRFLAFTICGWVCLRAAVFASGWWQGRQAEPYLPASAAARAVKKAGVSVSNEGFAPVFAAQAVSVPAGSKAAKGPPPLRNPVLENMVVMVPSGLPPQSDTPSFAAIPPVTAQSLPVRSLKRSRRWSASGWLFVRKAASAAIAPGSSLGGSQAGGRLAYRLNGDVSRPLAVSGGFYAPLETLSGAHVTAGLDWKPLAKAPVHLLAERRQAVGRDGRSAFSLTAYGGMSGKIRSGVQYDIYAQAGIVGARSRDLFADASIRLGAPVGDLKIGAGLWGAAQPGISRLDAGPQASYRLPVEGANIVVAIDWRMRIAGDAAPRSGPSLTLGTDF